MKITIRQLEDEDDAREVHRLAFPDDIWVGDDDYLHDHQFWVARDARGNIAGLCSAAYDPDTCSVFLSRAAVVKAYQGKGLHKRMIRVRCAWGRRRGARVAVTYTAPQNYESMVALLKTGFRFIEVRDGGDWHHLYRALSPDFVPAMLKLAFDWV